MTSRIKVSEDQSFGKCLAQLVKSFSSVRVRNVGFLLAPRRVWTTDFVIFQLFELGFGQIFVTTTPNNLIIIVSLRQV